MATAPLKSVADNNAQTWVIKSEPDFPSTHRRICKIVDRKSNDSAKRMTWLVVVPPERLAVFHCQRYEPAVKRPKKARHRHKQDVTSEFTQVEYGATLVAPVK